MAYKSIDILLVDDNPLDIKIILRAFEKTKCRNRIYTVEDSEKALDFIYHRREYSDAIKYPRPDLIILDIKMPKLSGFQVLEKLKRDPKYNSIPVVMMTTSKNEEDIVRSYRGGACGYIPKPVDFDELVTIVEGFNFYWCNIISLPDGKRVC